nr:MAG TPA: hypothetical protein [Caudoviricetes sp.]
MSKEITFLGMDVCKDMDEFASKLLCKKECVGMNEGQLAAYKMGIKNTLSLLRSTLDTGDTHAVVNISGLDEVTEFNIEELMKKLAE